MSDVMKIIDKCTNIQTAIDTMWNSDVDDKMVTKKAEDRIRENVTQIFTLLTSLEKNYLSKEGK